MAGIRNPVQRQTGVFMPGPVVADAGTRMILFAADKNGRTGDRIGKIRFHRLCEHFKSMPGKLRIPFLIPVVGHHDVMHERSSVLAFRNTVAAGFQK